jgi:hypothetical protein
MIYGALLWMAGVKIRGTVHEIVEGEIKSKVPFVLFFDTA